MTALPHSLRPDFSGQHMPPMPSGCVLASLILAGLMAIVSIAGCNLLSAIPDGPTPDDVQPPEPQPGPGPSPQYPEQQYWEALAVLVEKDTFVNSDQVRLTADRLKSAGWVSDLSRLSDLTRRVEITTANRQEIARKIRGQ